MAACDGNYPHGRMDTSPPTLGELVLSRLSLFLGISGCCGSHLGLRRCGSRSFPGLASSSMGRAAYERWRRACMEGRLRDFRKGDERPDRGDVRGCHRMRYLDRCSGLRVLWRSPHSKHARWVKSPPFGSNGRRRRKRDFAVLRLLDTRERMDRQRNASPYLD